MVHPERRVSQVAPGARPDELWTAADVAAYLKVSRSWVYHRAEANLLPYVRIGGLLRFEPEAVRQYARDGSSDMQRPRALPLRPRALRKGA
ncbi:MAG TPA: helix-turn-helix domain-containing protein [Polyangiaceae bacterium]|nr:helix-turn-helix domain-containing protein [Polyangiaceae bacterium]